MSWPDQPKFACYGPVCVSVCGVCTCHTTHSTFKLFFFFFFLILFFFVIIILVNCVFFKTLIHFIFNYFSYICSMYSYFRLASYSCSILKFLFFIRFYYETHLYVYHRIISFFFLFLFLFLFWYISTFFYSYVSECLLRRKAGRYLHFSLQNITSFVPLKNAVLSPLQDILKEYYIFFILARYYYSCTDYGFECVH